MIPDTQQFIDYSEEEKGYAESTINTYTETFQMLSRWVERNSKTLDELESGDVEDFIDWVKVKTDLDYTEIASDVFPALQMFFDWYQEDYLRNPCGRVDVDSILLVDGAEKYLNDKRNSLTDSTLKNRRTGLLQFSQWLDRELGLHPTELAGADIESYLSYLKGKGYTDGTISDKYVSVSQLYQHMNKQREEMGGWDSNAIKETDSTIDIDYENVVKRRNRLKSEDQYLNEEQKDLLLDNVQAPRLRNALLIELMWQTGIRKGEAANIELDDIDRDRREIWIPKHKSKSENSRTVYYESSLDTKMNIWLDGGERSSSKYASESTYLFLTQRAPQLDKGQINSIVRNAAEKAGIQAEAFKDASGGSRKKVVAHSLRHGFAVYSLENGMDLITLSEIMGHKDLNTTKEYLHFTKEGQRLEYLKSRQADGE